MKEKENESTLDSNNKETPFVDNDFMKNLYDSLLNKKPSLSEDLRNLSMVNTSVFSPLNLLKFQDLINLKLDELLKQKEVVFN